MIFLISASWVAGITGISHQHPVLRIFILPSWPYIFTGKIPRQKSHWTTNNRM
jgi:hypothetical protein